MSNANCTSCTSEDVRKEHSGLHHNTKGKVRHVRPYTLYHCNTCGRNFEITGEWRIAREGE